MVLPLNFEAHFTDSGSLLSRVRELVFGVGWVLILPRFFGLDGVLYSMPVSDLLTFLIAAFLILKIMKGLQAGKI